MSRKAVWKNVEIPEEYFWADDDRVKRLSDAGAPEVLKVGSRSDGRFVSDSKKKGEKKLMSSIPRRQEQPTLAP